MTIIDAHYHLVPNEGEINLHLGYDYTGDDIRADATESEIEAVLGGKIAKILELDI